MKIPPQGHRSPGDPAKGAGTACSEEARLHGLKLMKAGMTPSGISARSGVSTTQVRRLLRGDLPSMWRINCEAVLGITEDEAAGPLEFDGMVDTTGAMRRLRALAVQGFSVTFLAKEGGVTRRVIGDIRSGGNPRMLMSTLRSVTSLHDKFWDVDAADTWISLNATVRTRGYAAKRKWWPTEAWADIDDPDCKPSLKTPRYVILAENYKELSGMGYTLHKAAERLDVRATTLDRAIRYYEKKQVEPERVKA